MMNEEERARLARRGREGRDELCREVEGRGVVCADSEEEEVVLDALEDGAEIVWWCLRGGLGRVGMVREDIVEVVFVDCYR